MSLIGIDAAAVQIGIGESSHAWILVPVGKAPGALIFDVPPRTSELVRARTNRLTLRWAGELAQFPSFASAAGPSLWTVTDRAPAGFPTQERIVALTRSVFADGRWLTAGSGTPQAEPSIPGRRPMFGFTAAAVVGRPTLPALAALVGPGPEHPRPELLLHADRDWRPVENVPADLLAAAAAPDRTARWWMFPTADGLGVLSADQQTARAWIATITPQPPAPAAPVHRTIKRGRLQPLSPDHAQPLPAFAWRSIGVPPSVAHGMQFDDASVFAVTDAIVIARVDGTTLRAWRYPIGPAVRVPAWALFVNVGDVPANAAVFAVDGGRALAAVWDTAPSALPAVPPAAPPGASPPRLAMVEISSQTGRVLARGDADLLTPVTTGDYRFLAASLALIVATVAIFLVPPPTSLARPSHSQKDASAGNVAQRLPPGMSLAPPALRCVATAIDLAIALTLAAGTWGVPLAEMLTQTSLRSDEGQTVLASALAALIVLGGVSESLVGRTLGKAVVGLRVVRVLTPRDPDAAASPGLARSLLRNTIKYLVPPVPLLGMLADDFRHRADLWAGTAVASPIPAEPPDDGVE